MEQFRHQGSAALHYLFLIILLAMPLLMQGCTYSTIEKRKASLAMLESTNLADQKQRFGDLATLDGTRWLQQGKNGDLTIHRFHWEIPGAVMIHRQAFLYSGVEGRWYPDYLNALVLFQFDLETGELEEIHGTGYPDIEVDFKIPMHVLPSGKVIYNHGNWGWCRCDGENSLVIESASVREVLTPLTEEQYKAALQRRSENYAAQQREVTIEKERRSAERAELIARGLAGLSQGYIEASAQSQQLEDKQHAFLRDLQRDLNNQQIAREQAVRAQQQDTASSGMLSSGINKATLPIESRPAAYSNKIPNVDQGLNKQPKVQNTAITPAKPNNSEHTDREEVKRQAFNEAILVCTKPDASRHFQCKTPVDVISGGPADKDWATPEALVNWASSSCPDARKLPSTTHLVWGCGFAATNNSNSMDRSAGVDVKGRNIYYCTPKETSCRRTEP
ncbi:hypothetical protein BKE30_15440 [Alkanindiges hydrocarboniclasticus]|uniref:Lipoprotein n=1 Tax=Alkanindiges hydrocarboniclasticus TaxID=1907941 RepID=A0A1S8CRB7_9GAMM|nr:hypothetical protein [Alkanindiges hydrocarboniclasticus]ONG37034.1 hypothetical protein BKE30_15440 [Alkanindiges hydrocarboniclasticus]